MPQTARTFRVFVSSTFSDLKEERNALQIYVFPRLNELAKAHGCRFQAIDLRWGVSEEAALNQKTMRICLNEIERCQKVSPRPNFIILLGDRFGWRPLPYAILAEEFEKLLKFVPFELREKLLWREEQSDEMKGWYRRDENAVPPEYNLQPRYKGSRYERYEIWEKDVERPLITALEDAALKAGVNNEALQKYILSATGQEIMQGAMKVEDAHEHVFGFYRTITNINQNNSLTDSKDYIENDQELRKRQQQLKHELKRHLPGNVDEFTALLQKNGLTTAHIGSLPQDLNECLELNVSGQKPQTLCEAVWLRLSKVILTELSKLELINAEQKEQEVHLLFGKERAKFFIGREDNLQRINTYLNTNANIHFPMVIWGPSGSGKSSIIAKAIEEAGVNFPNATIISRFIGVSPDSSNIHSLLTSLLNQLLPIIGNILDVNQPVLDFGRLTFDYLSQLGIPLDSVRLFSVFKNAFNSIPKNKHLILFLDGLDQLPNTDNAIDLEWFPYTLKKNVHLVISTLKNEWFDSIEPHYIDHLTKHYPVLAELQRFQKPGYPTQAQITPMNEEEGKIILQKWLDNISRRLTSEQIRNIINKFVDVGGLPLYLKLSFDEAKYWQSYDGIPILFDQQVGLGSTISSVIQNMFRRLSHQKNHGEVLVSHALGYLNAARNGLSEDELLDVLWSDKEVRNDFFIRNPKSSKNISSLPVAVWSALFYDLEPYLSERRADGTSLLTFYNRQLAEEARRLYCPTDKKATWHYLLAQYFCNQSLWLDNDKRIINLRKISELPYQQVFAGLFNEYKSILTSYDFIRAKIKFMGPRPLVDDYDLILSPDLPTSYTQDSQDGNVENNWEGLKLIRNAILLSVPILKKNINQLADQLFGRLSGIRKPDVVNLLNDIDSKVRHPWLKPLGNCLNSPGGPLERTFELEGNIEAIAVTPDGQRLVSMGYRKLSIYRSLKVWNVKSGEVIHSLDEGSSFVLTKDGHRAIYFTSDDILKVWDIETGNILKAIESGIKTPGPVYAMAVSPDERKIAFSKGDKFTVWDLESNQKFTLNESDGCVVLALAFTSDGKHIAAATCNTLLYWDLNTRKMVRKLNFYSELGGFASFTPGNTLQITRDGQQIIFALNNFSSLFIWNILDGKIEKIRFGHNDDVIQSWALSSNKHQVICSSRKSFDIWDYESGEFIRDIKCISPKFDYLTILKDGRIAVSGNGRRDSKSWKINIWNLETMNIPQANLEKHEGSITNLIVSPNGRYLISTSKDMTLKIWDIKNKQVLYTVPSYSRNDVISFTPDGNKVLFSNSEDYIVVMDLKSMRVVKTLEGRVKGLISLSVTSDGRKVITETPNSEYIQIGSGNTLPSISYRQGNYLVTSPSSPFVNPGFIEVRDMVTGRIMFSRKGQGVRISPNGTRGVSYDITTEKTLIDWDIANGKTLKNFHKEAIPVKNNYLITPDGKRVISLSVELLRIWDLESGEPVSSLSLSNLTPDTDPHRPMVTTPDGQHLILQASQKGIALLNIETGQPTYLFDGIDDYIRDMKVTADGRRVILLTSDNSISVLDLVTQKCLVKFYGEDNFSTLEVTPDAETVIVGDELGRVHFFHIKNVINEAPIVTAWLQNTLAYGCPSCQRWAEISQASLETKISCPACGKPIKLNRFIIHGDWQAVARARQGVL